MEGLFQPMHLIVILVIALLIFGPSKLSQLGKGLGEGIRNFKDAVNDDPSKKAQVQLPQPTQQTQQPAAPTQPPTTPQA